MSCDPRRRGGHAGHQLKATPLESYDEDFYGWVLGRAGILRARRFGAPDLENLIEELEGLPAALQVRTDHPRLVAVTGGLVRLGQRARRS